jgi:hypothetical protein
MELVTLHLFPYSSYPLLLIVYLTVQKTNEQGFSPPLYQMLNLSKGNVEVILMLDFIKQHAMRRCTGEWMYSCAHSEPQL